MNECGECAFWDGVQCDFSLSNRYLDLVEPFDTACQEFEPEDDDEVLP